jgi:hypothetical protein
VGVVGRWREIRRSLERNEAIHREELLERNEWWRG